MSWALNTAERAENTQTVNQKAVRYLGVEPKEATEGLP